LWPSEGLLADTSKGKTEPVIVVKRCGFAETETRSLSTKKEKGREIAG